ncbi:L10-interacting MYB domain-containing protein isoform X3 [Gossypium hirsutum]|uniref:L10-interacting MYB domain-containing protein isoform X3 n=1 Tax=Gossypium hirsutum TaxID=3635 RepID=A0A1U8I9T6_GOSHI|nr:L10-interacting MYB domain-containing protein isoform X3 [Gossypium hirsutum]
MSTSAIEVSGEKVKAVWDKRLTETFYDICIKEILKGNRSGTYFTKDGWLKIMINFEKETGMAFSQRQLKNRWDALKKEWKAWKKLKGEDTGLGWNPIKRTVDASDDWWESRLKVVPEAQKFRTSGIDPEFEGKLDQMFMGIVATGDKAWAPSSGTLCSDFFEDVNNEIHEEDDEENVRNDVHISNDVQIDGNGQKRKNPDISSSHFKTGRKKSSKQIGEAARLSSQIEKLCNAPDNMSQATSSLTHVMDPYGIPQAAKVLDSMSEEVPEASLLYFFTLRLLLNKDKRIMFLSINPKIRVLWLKMEMEDS